ncbi:unnamed protein product [Rhizophagus irregularis]|nr:unnamed protein product [Rhizophagus irregularis]CAB5366863.1 unnamed protein product [Rhizophagus irregularis]
MIFYSKAKYLGLTNKCSGSPALPAPAIPTYVTTKTIIIITTTVVAANVSEVASTVATEFKILGGLSLTYLV